MFAMHVHCCSREFVGGLSYCIFCAAMPRSTTTLDDQLQTLDVQIVDVLAQLEALLRHSHSIQRELLKLRAEAPPPRPAPPERVKTLLTAHATDMRRDCKTLTRIVAELSVGIGALPLAKR
jgi:hypothetical protein